MIRWHAELYIGKSRTADAIFSSESKFSAIHGIIPYVLSMVGDDEEYKIVVKKIEV